MHTACRLPVLYWNVFIQMFHFPIDKIEISNDNISFRILLLIFGFGFSLVVYLNMRGWREKGPKIEKHFSIYTFGFSELMKLFRIFSNEYYVFEFITTKQFFELKIGFHWKAHLCQQLVMVGPKWNFKYTFETILRFV